nr:chemotaxis protein CheA [Gemmatimonadaceae bacterium]MCU0627370.1 chemotaxis protein CheA [Gemmatimonadaceae bacterium]
HAESLLSRVREKELAYGQEVASLSLRSADLLRDLLDAVDAALAGGGRVQRPDSYDALLHDLHHVDEIIAGARAVTVTGVSTKRAEQSAEAVAGAARRKEAGESSVRVRTDRLDRLIDLVGELVIAQSIIGGDDGIRGGANHELLKKVTHAGKIVRELQDLSMSMRMVPLKTTFQKLARVVRDVAIKAGKQVEFVTEGEETELDRNMVDVVGDPLVHMVRNSVDHGIEKPDARGAAGKGTTGTVTLRAYNQGGFVVVELRDDGRGLDREKILAKAISVGLAQPDQKYTDEQVFQFIFAPGFSTAAQVTDISGRGVGMDVVRRNIESIRGRIEIDSVLGQGTTFRIRLPLTLAVTDGMLVRVGSERYIVPITNIHMTFRPERAMLQTVTGRGEVVMLRGEVMPILRVHEVMGVTDATTDPCEALLMVVADGDRRTALLVDELLGQQQVVAKSLGEQLGSVAGIAGGAILGDGRVGIILDVAEMVHHARGNGTFAAAA